MVAEVSMFSASGGVEQGDNAFVESKACRSVEMETTV